MNTLNIDDIAERLQLCMPDLPIRRSPELRIANLGLDSMDTVELLCVITEEFGVRLTDSDFYPEQTIGGLLTAILNQL